jgi:2'-5' RNA ligase
MNTPATEGRGSSIDAAQDRTQRLFFALWPEDALRQQLASRTQSLVQDVRGRPVAVENLHITLAFLGSVDAHQRACVERMADAVISPAFEFTLDHFGHWSRSRVLWFGAEETPEPLVLLVDTLTAGARECGLSLDSRPYRAHLTLMRKVSRAPEMMPVEPLSWPVSRFVLMRSVFQPHGVSYEVLREWPLRASAED